MAKISELRDDLTGQLGSVGSGNGARTGSDQYMQSMSAQMPSMNGPSGFASTSPIPAQPPAQLAIAPAPSQRQMPPPMSGASDIQAMQHQAMQRAAMESDVMRPPYSQPYGAMSYATQPGFQGAPVGSLQMPVYAANDSCSLQGPPPRMTPAAQMQMLQQQRMAQLQAQSQAQQQAQAQASACLNDPKKVKQMQKAQKAALKAMGANGTGDCGKQKMWINLIWAIVVLVILALLIAAIVVAVRSYKYSRMIASTLSSPIVGA